MADEEIIIETVDLITALVDKRVDERMAAAMEQISAALTSRGQR